MTMRQSSGGVDKPPVTYRQAQDVDSAEFREVVGQVEIEWLLTFAAPPFRGAAVTPSPAALAFHDFLQVLFHQDSMTL
jgi:hypothetical protein